MEVKYEPIFGDQSLFGKGPEDANIVGKYMGNPRFYKVCDSGVYFYRQATWHKADKDYPGVPLLAMRRIIKEPKRWTWEDKKVGVLPEVGAKCSHCHSVDERTVLSVTDKYVGIECDNSDINPYFVTHAEFIQYYIPIETPAEKSQREEDEFVDVIVSEYNKMPSSVSFKAGIRAAYRKLKGGE